MSWKIDQSQWLNGEWWYSLDAGRIHRRHSVYTYILAGYEHFRRLATPWLCECFLSFLSGIIVLVQGNLWWANKPVSILTFPLNCNGSVLSRLTKFDHCNVLSCSNSERLKFTCNDTPLCMIRARISVVLPWGISLSVNFVPFGKEGKKQVNKKWESFDFLFIRTRLYY